MTVDSACDMGAMMGKMRAPVIGRMVMCLALAFCKSSHSTISTTTTTVDNNVINVLNNNI